MLRVAPPLARARRHRLRAWVGGVLLAIAAQGPVGAILPVSATGIAATASVAPNSVGLGETAGYTVTVKNIGTLRIGSVLIRPPIGWTTTGCTSSTAMFLGACYWHISTPATAILPGNTRTFQISAKAPAGVQDRTGLFFVFVGPVASPFPPVIPAFPISPGLRVTAYAFLLTHAVVAAGPAAIGSACPVSNKSAPAGTTVTIVICGTNRTPVGLIPTAAQSSLAGTFIGSPGTFSAGTIPAGATNVVLGDWNGAQVTPTPSSGRTVIARIGSLATRTSPLTTFTGYTATGPDLTIAKSHSGTFAQGDTGDTYTITVTNSGGVATSGTATVNDTLPAGLTPTGAAGTGWSCPAPSGQNVTCSRSDVLNPGGSYPDITLTVNVAGNAPASVTNRASVSGGGDVNTSNNSDDDQTTIAPGPDLTIAKSHTGTITQGDTGRTYKITVTNSGGAPSSGTVTVSDTLPSGFTPTNAAGTGWTCNVVAQAVTCTRADALAAGASYPDIAITFDVAANATTQTNTASVSGGNDVDTANNSADDPTTVTPGADLTIAKSHTGNFTQGDSGDTYTVTVTNSGTGVTSGTVTVTDTLPAGLTPTGAAGTGWTCPAPSGQTVGCTRSDALNPGSSYPDITITVNVSVTAPASLDNTASVSGGGETNTANDSATNTTTINACSAPTTPSGTIPQLTYNTAMATATFTTTGTCGAITWSASGLPAGIGINSSTGKVTGTPTQTGSFPLATITATDAASHSASTTFTVTVVPKLVDDSYNVVGNTQLDAGGFLPAPTTPQTTDPNGVLANDSSDSAIAATPVVDAATTGGGTITIAANGSFLYTPPLGQDTGTDTYVYTATSNGVSNTATITFNISDIVWFVDNASVAATHDGRSNAPFTGMGSGANNLGSANSNAGPDFGAYIYVSKGAGTTTGSYTFKHDQTLIGAGATLTVGTLTVTGNAANTPALGGTLTLANNVTTDGFDMSTGSLSAIVGASVTGLNVKVRDISTTTGTGVSLTGSGNTGTMVFNSVSTGAAPNGITVSNFATPGTLTVNGGTIANTTGTGINLDTVADPTLTGVTINEGAATALALASTPLTLGGSLTIATTAGGTGVAFSGGTASIAAGANTFSITNTGAGQGIVATSGGTIFVTGSNSTISTATGIALNVANTTIGASGLTFKSISSNGATNGINLDTTGSSGGLTVTGNGSAGTGGTIQNSTDSGIRGNSTRTPALSWMSISNNGNAVNEGGVRLTDVTGTGSITSSTVTGGYEDNIYLKNDTGTATFTVQGPSCSITDNSTSNGNNGVNILAATTASVTATVDNCSLHGNRAVAIGADGADSATLNVTIKNNTITQGSPNQGNQGIQVSDAGNGNVTFLVDNNKIGTSNGTTASPLKNTGINIFNGSAGSAVMAGRVSNNTVLNDPTTPSGTSNGFGIRVFNSNLAQMRVKVLTNTVKNVSGDYGILAESSGTVAAPSAPNGRLDIDMESNTVSVGTGALDAIRVQSRNFNTVCARIVTNTTGGGGAGYFGIFVRQANSAVFDLDGWNGLGTPEAYVASQNPAGGTTGSTATTSITGVAAGTCSFTGVP